MNLAINLLFLCGPFESEYLLSWSGVVLILLVVFIRSIRKNKFLLILVSVIAGTFFGLNHTIYNADKEYLVYLGNKWKYVDMYTFRNRYDNRDYATRIENVYNYSEGLGFTLFSISLTLAIVLFVSRIISGFDNRKYKTISDENPLKAIEIEPSPQSINEEQEAYLKRFMELNRHKSLSAETMFELGKESFLNRTNPISRNQFIDYVNEYMTNKLF